MEKPVIDPEEWIVSLFDVKRLYISMWKRLLRWAFVGAIVSYLYFGNAEVVYQAKASFKEGVERSSHESFFKDLIGGFSSQGMQQPQTTSLMKSNQVLRPLAEKLGMQIAPFKKEWKIAQLCRRYKETWAAEKGLLTEETDPFIFANVHYDGEEPIFFRLAFSTPEEYTVFNQKNKKELAKGKLGVPCSFKGVTLTLKSVPETLKMESFYPFMVNPWISAVGDLRSRIKIKGDKDNKSILVISAIHRNRYVAAEIVNELMAEFLIYLKREYDSVAKMQLAYLEGKQEQIFSKMDQLFDQHIDYLSRNLEKNGFIGLDQETQSLLFPHHQMHGKLLAIDVELKRLDEIEKEGKGVPIAEDSSFSHSFNQFTQKIQDLKQHRDLIELSMSKEGKPAPEMRREDLKEVREARFAVEKLIQEINHGKEISASDLSPGLVLWAKALTDEEEREDFAEYLENYSRLLSMREKMLQERIFYGKGIPEELEGIDLGSARSLFMQYNSKLDASQANLRSYAQLKNELQNPYFDLASLSSILRDSLSQKIVEESAVLELQLKDEKHHSMKEEERWKEEIALKRKILGDHLDQLILVEELNVDLLKEKMLGLQSLSLDCINQQISVLHEQIRDGVQERRKALLIEKEVLERKMEEIRTSLAKILPEKWRFEKWLNIKTEMVNRVMETITEVVESKSISNHLHHVESKPLDPALVPGGPQTPYLYRMTYLGAFVFPFFVFSLAFIRRLLKGFPITDEKIKALRLPFLGRISPLCDGKLLETPTGPDLELLRNMALFFEGAKVVGLIGGRGPDYSYALSENLARRHAKSIIIRCDFLAKSRKEDAPGIFQIWKGEIGELPIRHDNGFDWITAGGYTPFGTEIVQSQTFHELISFAKKKYDWVFLLFRSPLSSVESQAALRLCDKAIVTLSEEQIEELTPFIHWGYDGDNSRITFITS